MFKHSVIDREIANAQWEITPVVNHRVRLIVEAQM